MLYRSLLRRLLFRLPPETAHELALHFLANDFGLTRLAAGSSPQPFGELQRFGLKFSNPVGLAAGFDKDGIALNGLAALGFGFIEAGTVTFQPQPGSERPRLFRLPEDQALINRAGFNNKGAMAFARQLAHSKAKRTYVLGVSIGKSKITPLEAAIDDYLKTFEVIYPVADYVAVNVSSPNTPGLRSLQQAQQLESLLSALQSRNEELSKQNNSPRLPLLLKISPDLNFAELRDIVAVVKKTSLAGIIATNTTTSRAGLRSSAQQIRACGEGGLSGLPIRTHSSNVLAKLYQLTGGAIPLVGVGGIFTAADAWEKICAGASLIQLYTGFIYRGPGIVREINKGLKQILDREGIDSLDQAVGCRATAIAQME